MRNWVDVGALYRTGYARVDSGLGDWDDEHVRIFSVHQFPHLLNGLLQA